MKTALEVAMILLLPLANAVAKDATTSIYESPDTPVAKSRLDKIVFAKLASLHVQPVRCSDAVFVRRAFLDVIGTLPTAQEARDFIEDTKTKNKRQALIDQLMQRDEFADYWSMRWGDVLRIKAEFPVNLWPNAAQAYHRWVRASIVNNRPYDEFARELLTSSGSNFRVGPVNFYRALQNKSPESIATAVALTLMGTRTELWPEQKLKDFSNFFAQIGYKPTREWKEEYVFWDPLGSSRQVTEEKPSTKPISPPRDAILPDGKKVKLPPDRDPRVVFADWLITPENPWFSKCIVNRIWGWIMGRGIIEPADDIRADNPPSDPELLAYLEKELIDSHYDLKHIYRLILTSETYQLSSVPRSTDPRVRANFGSYPLRRLDAEVLIDAINKITGTTDLYTSAIPEPFTYIPSDQAAIAIADGSITSSFLALFGRSARATGMADERINKLDASQWLHILNSSHIQQKLERGPNLLKLFNAAQPTDSDHHRAVLDGIVSIPDCG